MHSWGCRTAAVISLFSFDLIFPWSSIFPVHSLSLSVSQSLSLSFSLALTRRLSLSLALSTAGCHWPTLCVLSLAEFLSLCPRTKQAAAGAGKPAGAGKWKPSKVSPHCLAVSLAILAFWHWVAAPLTVSPTCLVLPHWLLLHSLAGCHIG